jgi:hypothetical protein
MTIRASYPPVASSISFVHAFETVGFAAACASGVSCVSEAFTSGTTNARAPSELSRQRSDESKTHPQGQRWQIEQGRHETFLKKVLGGGEMGISDYPTSVTQTITREPEVDTSTWSHEPEPEVE